MSFEIAGRRIGPGEPCFVIAEAGVNHGGNLEAAHRLVDIAGAARADAVKFQTFRAEDLVTPEAPKAAYQRLLTPESQSQFDMLQSLELSLEAHRSIAARCQNRSLLFLSSPFDEKSVDLLDDLGVPAFKVGSGEITNLPLLEHVARKGKPILLSTGMSALDEVDTAVARIRAAGNPRVVLLQCVSNYPAQPRDSNLRAMCTMAERFALPVGYSDHVMGSEVALAAVALGACVIEKHFTESRAQRGPDHEASLEPAELEALVRGIRIVEDALGDGRKRPVPSELEVAAVIRKSLVAASDIPTGTVITESHVAAKRPGTGLPPTMRSQILGRKAIAAIPKGALIRLEMLE